MKITTLIENTCPAGQDQLTPEHGLSLLIEFDETRLLFDTGVTDAFARNAERLSLNLRDIHDVIISHHHYDHGGGLSHILASNPDAKIYLKEAPKGALYLRAAWVLRKYIDLDKNLLREYPERFTFVQDFQEILPRVYILPQILQNHPHPEGNRYLFEKDGSRWQRDDFQHELILVVREQNGLVVFSGCSHNGILNMIETVIDQFDDVPIKAVIGGFHLIGFPRLNTMGGSRLEIEDLGRKLLSYGVGQYYTGHCTGQKAYQALETVMGKRIEALHTGKIFNI